MKSDFDVLHNVFPGRHFYQFYKNREDYLRVMIPYFHAGLEKGDACLWLISEKKGFENVLLEAKILIPDFEKYRQSGQFEIRPAEDWYLTNGRFDMVRAMRKAEEYAAQVRSDGYLRLRGSGDAVAIPHEDWPKVEIYEGHISSWIHENQVIALCAYPILECTLNDTKGVLEQHDDVLVGRL